MYFTVVGIIWLSTFSFMVAYIAENADASDQPTVVLITGSVSITIYELLPFSIKLKGDN